MNRMCVGAGTLALVASSIGGAYYASGNMFASLMATGVLCCSVALSLTFGSKRYKITEDLIRRVLITAAGAIAILFLLAAI